MKTSPIVVGELCLDQPGFEGLPYAPAFGDVYHPRAGAFTQARHVFLAGNGLPQRWRGRQRFVVLETGFGLGNNFLATWQAWRDDPQRPERLIFVSIEKHPLRAEDLALAHASSDAPELARELLATWPPLTPDLHTLDFEDGRMRLLLALGDIKDWLPELVAEVDAFYLDGFAPAKNAAMWDARLYPALSRLAAADATAATWSVARDVREGLASAGFSVERQPGLGGKREISVARFTGAQRRAAPPPGRRQAPRARSALVIGAGVAGAAAADALAREGLTVTVLERRSAPAQETSSNRAGLFHGVLHSHDGAHAQLLRAAALRTAQRLQGVVGTEALPGAVGGLLRGGGDESAEALQALADRLGLPAGFVQALSADMASQRAGLPLPRAQWLYPGGGWVSPPALVGHLLSAPGITVRNEADVVALARHDAQWQALDAQGRMLAEADVAVVAGASDGLALLSQAHPDSAAWPLGRQRGQVSLLPPALAAGLPHPSLPLASGGYLIALPPSLGGGLLCGATSQPGDTDPAVRVDDHRRNLARIAELTGTPLDATLAEHPALQGKVGWRLAADDRLPLVGPVPADALQRAGARRQEQPRQVPRVEGLYLLTALGSRGLTMAPLLGEVLAAWITGAPVPLAASLMDAIDPARFVARAARKPVV
ncbi:bifunctional tRNA (5-methylaminomethyl-2-thiouridine)(34)-methyltransferase MnmD/FAD-dependent 5-carboxymethylaminomethyl-2-thiouridine(34) oxidoreductase MnmC [Ideonella sp. 4Y11]|uniref:tRNA 5-methylaminomethyl-2-thiouridine biosynthesis bifunctional protein MnmC n=1 Tax=Ideonella aquatica TaxID=2824119 RepID=A0A940YR94_9BURK|nr:bifunctional tRNA (5-methylaminomethyl-2-thiouridine)(34)-methyltransferase MnmD/FAD-dependent 5-carboxymethylaminomethyl-2-thiouridine(34) oxidoreductase MnmC [Ideonella aquatica]MBQ0961432.1 bifunctional tRNA (5-methylaminomethyl-2-thiouridine)(34)-methyltransferase MnmD/FAD-dependent 5-carboxymethylaminomethyl-2-thiouridine(34) oxidoreductase MnmC [Ideonella aquatica]